MRKYIFMTTSTKYAGGNQCYLAAKAKYLEETGWDVYVFCSAPKPKSIHCPIAFLEKYLKKGNITAMGIPPFLLPKFMVRRTLNRMINSIGPVDQYEDCIVESHMDVDSQWGELLASRIGARHYNYMMPEDYRTGKTYENKIDFYKFKFKRKELLGSMNSFPRLFDGYLNVSESDFPAAVLIDESPIQDVYNEVVDKLERKDWNICYIGRGNKPYVANVISDTAKFAKLYPNKKIQLVFVTDDLSEHNKLIEQVLQMSSNLNIKNLGMLHPIPRILYDKIDVVIAGSGSARHSCEEGATVIVADPESKQSLGILGYETMNSMFRDEDSVLSDFCDALKRVLVNKDFVNLKNRWPGKLGVAKCTEQNFWLFSQSERKKEYYDEKKLLEGRVDINRIIKCYVANYFPRVLNLSKYFK